MFRSIGPLEIGLILFIVLVVFGVGKLPQVGAALGKGINEFRSAVRGDHREEKDAAAAKTEETKESKT
jgi:sec-independent protein translocase protein TatA